MNELYDLDRLTVGTVGPPGQRVFLLQARAADQLVTLKVEKGQVAALATYLGQLLQDLPSPGHLPEDLDLEGPPEPDWIVGALGVTYDDAIDRIVLVAEEISVQDVEDEDDDDVDDEGGEDGEVVRLAATREQAAALAIRGTRLVEAGRPPCPLCGFPLDPSGHACPRTNGNRPPTP